MPRSIAFFFAMPREKARRIHREIAHSDIERLLKRAAQVYLAEVLLDLLFGQRSSHDWFSSLLSLSVKQPVSRSRRDLASRCLRRDGERDWVSTDSSLLACA